MTKTFDDNSRVKWESQINFGDLSHDGESVSNLLVCEISPKSARPLIAKYHYSKTFPDSTKYCYAGYLNGKIAGIIVFGMGTSKNQYTALIPDIKKGEYLELSRLWSPDGMPKNTESKLISNAIKMLPKEVKMIISFADPSRNHLGIIYQATNFYYCGTSNGGKMLVTADGTEKHPRLLGIYRMRHPEYKNLKTNELMNILGYKYASSYGKHRYVLFRGTKNDIKSMKKQIIDRILPYPKTELT